MGWDDDYAGIDLHLGAVQTECNLGDPGSRVHAIIIRLGLRVELCLSTNRFHFHPSSSGNPPGFLTSHASAPNKLSLEANVGKLRKKKISLRETSHYAQKSLSKLAETLSHLIGTSGADPLIGYVRFSKCVRIRGLLAAGLIEGHHGESILLQNRSGMDRPTSRNFSVTRTS